jgi:hypothetical protein
VNPMNPQAIATLAHAMGASGIAVMAPPGGRVAVGGAIQRLPQPDAMDPERKLAVAARWRRRQEMSLGSDEQKRGCAKHGNCRGAVHAVGGRFRAVAPEHDDRVAARDDASYGHVPAQNVRLTCREQDEHDNARGDISHALDSKVRVAGRAALLGGNPVLGCRRPRHDEEPGADHDDACAQQPR